MNVIEEPVSDTASATMIAASERLRSSAIAAR
jgi:hypothetical protein